MKRTVYYVLCALLTCCVCAAWVALIWLEISRTGDIPLRIILLVVAALCALLRLDSLVHESGHLVFGVLAGLHLRRVSFGRVSFGEGGVRLGSRSAAGETQFSLKKPQNAHASLIAATVGGPVLGILFGVVMLVLYYVLPTHPALTFFTLFSLWCFAEAVMELLPAELPAGKTDGLMLKELVQKTGETEVAVRVMQAQLLAKDGDYTDIPRELLYDVPVIREDSPAFMQLLRLRAAYCAAAGDADGAAEAQSRLRSIEEDA